MPVMRGLECFVEIETKFVLIRIAVALGFLVNPVEFGVEIVGLLDLLGVLGWRLSDVVNSRLPVKVGPDGIQELG